MSSDEEKKLDWGEEASFDDEEEGMWPESPSHSDSDEAPKETEEKDEVNPYFIGEGAEESSDEDDGKRVIKTAKEKRFQEMKKAIAKLSAAMKNNDWRLIEIEWDGVLKVSTKYPDKVFPKFYVSFLVELDNKINEMTKETLKSMKAKKAHFYNRMKQHWKKFLKEDKETEDKIALYKSNPDTYEDKSEAPEETTTEKPAEPAGEDKKEEWTPEKIDKKIKELLKERGTKHYVTGQVHSHIKTFRFFLSITPELSRQLSFRFLIVNALFDTNQGATHLVINTWKKIYNELVIILDALFDNPSLRLVESVDDFASENVVTGHLLFSVERLHDEYIRSLQNIDPQTPDYLQRLAHENDMLILLQYTSKYYETIQQQQSEPRIINAIAEISARQLDYLYYKHEAVGGGVEVVTFDQQQVVEDIEEEEKEPEVKEAESLEDVPEKEEVKEEDLIVELISPRRLPPPVTNLRETVSHLANLGNKHSENLLLKRRVMLQHVYHLALHDQYGASRDMLLMAHLPEQIHKAQVNEQILYNRVMVQLGMAAFRAGKIEDANACLQDIIQAGKDKAKELLAQGITRYQGEKNIEQEKQERSRQIPYHMHINLDLIEFVLLVCGMLLEIPVIAQNRFKEVKRKILSNFRKSYDFYNDRQFFTGPPESTKEAVIVAAKALEKGDWKSCRDTLKALDIWKFIPNHQAVFEKITTLMQEQGLRTYLFTYGQYYDTIHVSHLAQMFELDNNATHALISNMMMSAELQASFDQISGAIIIEAPDVTPLQHLALNFAEKANILLENTDQPDQRPMHGRWTDQQQGQRTGQKQQYPRAVQPAGQQQGKTPSKTEKPYVPRKNNNNNNKQQQTTKRQQIK